MLRLADACLYQAKASGDYQDADVLVDDVNVGKLERQSFAGRMADRLIPKPDFFPKNMVSLAMDVADLAIGGHTVRVIADGEEIHSGEFLCPLSESPLIIFVEPARPCDQSE